jgi:hypothetical protein
MSLLTVEELRSARNFHTDESLWKLCREAASYAVRPPFSPEDRADCAAELMTAALATVQTDAPIVRHGSPASVLWFIGQNLDRDETSITRQLASMPRVADSRFTFTALANRAADWRRSEVAARERAELGAGRDSAHHDEPSPAVDPTVHARKLAEISTRAAAIVAAEACEALGYDAYMAPFAAADAARLPNGAERKFSPVACLLYQWARCIDGEQAASELGVGFAAWRKRTSRAAKQVRESYSLPELLAAIAGEPCQTNRELFATTNGKRVRGGHDATAAKSRIIAAGDWIFAPRDESREASADFKWPHDDRLGTDAGSHSPRHESAVTARAACKTTYQRAAPVASRTRRDVAHRDGLSDAHRIVRQRAALGAALQASDSKPSKNAVGRTAGKPPERMASRVVRLGIE